MKKANLKDKKEQDIIDRIFSSLDVISSGYIKKEDLIEALNRRGILEDDIRVKDVILSLNKQFRSGDISAAAFRRVVSPYITLIEKALTGNLIIPDFKNFCSFVTNLYNRTIQNKEGTVSDYIPELRDVSPNYYAISICTVDGQRFNLGEYHMPYLANAISKVVNYCLVLDEHGEEVIHKRIGREYKGRNSSELILNKEGLPHNPLNDAGAIIAASLVRPDLMVKERLVYVMKKWQQLSGDIAPGLNNAAFLSEKSNSDADLAMAYFLRQKKLFAKNLNLDELLEFYFQCLSIETTTQAQAVIAATLANAGVCPTNGGEVLKLQTTKNCLSLMYSCGMGDYSSEFSFLIGLPAKSSISGSIMVVVPNVMGISIYSPRINADGNSVKALDFCRKLVQRFNFHNYDSLIKHPDKIDPRLLKNETKMISVMAVCSAASKGDLYEIQRLVASGVDLNEGDYDARTGIHLAASEGHEEVVKYFISQKVDINPRDRWGGTPLSDAVRGQHTKVVAILEGNGARL